MLLSIRHETVHRYANPVDYTIQLLRLTPRQQDQQNVLSWHVAISGKQRQQTDAYGNVTHLLTLDRPHDTIRIMVTGEVETRDEQGHILRDPGSMSLLAFVAETPLTRADPALREFVRHHLGHGGDPMGSLRGLMDAICDHVACETGASEGQGSAAQAFAQGRGVCQDHAHVFIACCRAARIPARFVSGYLYIGDEQRGPHATIHAWVDAWVDGTGWVSFDVAHRRFAGAEYCRLAVGRDYLDASPVRGVRRGSRSEETPVSSQAAAQQQQ